MMGLWLMIAALPGALTAKDQEHSSEPPPAPSWDMIRFEVKSWGRDVYSWQFTPRYGGVHMEFAMPNKGQSQERTIAYRPLPEDESRYGDLEAIIAKLPLPAPDTTGCKDLLPDLVYGTIRLTRGATTKEISWNSSCQDKDYAMFLAVLREADTLVRVWMKDIPVARTETEAFKVSCPG